jgi:hypothetical protein
MVGADGGRLLPPTEWLEPPVVGPWDGAVTSPYALVTLAAGRKGEELLEVSGPLLRRYAERWGWDFHVISGEAGSFPVGRKWEVSAILPHYERVVWLDADVLVSPECPNLLEVVRPGTLGLHNDWPWLASSDWVMAEYGELARSQGFPLDLPRSAWNTGVWVADREHAFVFAPPRFPFPRRHCVEQWHEALLIHQHRAPVTLLPSEFNWEWWVTRQPLVEPIDGVFVYHYAGLLECHEERLEQMRAMAARLGGDT